MSVEAKCPHCGAENIWGDCDECSSNDWKGHFTADGLSSVECRKCGNIEYPPIQCVECDKNINFQFFRNTDLIARLRRYASAFLIVIGVIILGSIFV
jgi:hypothetical protein